MKRRKFMKNAGLVSASIFTGSAYASTVNIEDKPQVPEFKLNYAIHEGLFYHHAGKEIVDQIRYARTLGFRAYEDNDMRLRPAERQKQLGDVLEHAGMIMGVIVGHSLDWKQPTLSRGDSKIEARFLEEIRESVNVAKRCRSKWIVVVPGVMTDGVDIVYQRANFIALLRKAIDIVTPHKLTLLLEPLNFRDHPRQLLPDVATIYQTVKAVNSKYCKILFDVYHVQIHTGNVIPNIDLTWDEIAYFQVADNPGRMEPNTGEINYRNIFKHIYNKGFRGLIGMEHSNSKEGKGGEVNLVEVYRYCDAF